MDVNGWFDIGIGAFGLIGIDKVWMWSKSIIQTKTIKNDTLIWEKINEIKYEISTCFMQTPIVKYDLSASLKNPDSGEVQFSFNIDEKEATSKDIYQGKQLILETFESAAKSNRFDYFIKSQNGNGRNVEIVGCFKEKKKRIKFIDFFRISGDCEKMTVKEWESAVDSFCDEVLKNIKANCSRNGFSTVGNDGFFAICFIKSKSYIFDKTTEMTLQKIIVDINKKKKSHLSGKFDTSTSNGKEIKVELSANRRIL